ncbi:MAG: type 1 glutamine amidotransferase domain-containing protein [Pseudomonadota bacterium]
MILCLLPLSGFDPTESAVPWKALRDAGIDVTFATPDGKAAQADTRLVSDGFGPLNFLFMTRKEDLAAYAEMADCAQFRQPLSYADVDPAAYAGLLIPGGHAAGVKSMLESAQAQAITLAFFRADKPVAAVCHGVLLLARTIDPATGKSVLHGRRTTAVTAVNMELPAWLITAPWLGSYYRTYPRTVQDEVTAALAEPGHFLRGPFMNGRDTSSDMRAGFIVQDGNYLSARWPGDCHRFAKALVDMCVVKERLPA